MDLTLAGNKVTYNMRVAVLVSCGENYLVQKASAGDYYILIGGRVKFAESLLDAAKRETKEELGIDVKELVFCGVNEAIFDLDNNDDMYHEHTFLFRAVVDADAAFSGDIDVIKMSESELLSNKVYPQNIMSIFEANNTLVFQSFNELKAQANGDDLSFTLKSDKQNKRYDTLNIRATAIIRKGDTVIVDTLGTFDAPIGGRMQQLELSLSGMKREIEEELGIKEATYAFRGIAEDYFSHGWQDKTICTHFIHFVYEVNLNQNDIISTSEAVIKYLGNDALNYDRFKFKAIIPFINSNEVYFASGITAEILKTK